MGCKSRRNKELQSTLLITTPGGGASKKCPYSRSVVIPEVSLYVLQLDGTLLRAWTFCRYSRIVIISAVVISEVDCSNNVTFPFSATWSTLQLLLANYRLQ